MLGLVFCKRGIQLTTITIYLVSASLVSLLSGARDWSLAV